MDNTNTIVSYRVEERRKGTEKWMPVYGTVCLSEMEVYPMLYRTPQFSECEYRVVKVTKVIQLISTEVMEIT